MDSTMTYVYDSSHSCPKDLVLIVFTCYDFRFCSKISMPVSYEITVKILVEKTCLDLYRENSYSHWCETEIWKTWDRCWCAGHFFLSQAAWSGGSQRGFAVIFGWDLMMEITRDCNPVLVLAGKPLFFLFLKSLVLFSAVSRCPAKFRIYRQFAA